MNIKFLFVLIVAGIMLSGCSGKTDIQKDSFSGVGQETGFTYEEIDVQYIDESADWPSYANVSALIKEANVVVVGKVTGISFQVLDLENGGSPTEKSEQRNRSLCTIYDLEVDTSYKGNTASKLRFFMYGGLKEKYLEEQLAAIVDFGEKRIPVMTGMPEINIGETYLFVFYQYKDKMPTPLNLKQGVYKIDDPLQKDAYSYVSPKEIISYFGEDKWKAFISQEDAAE